MAFLSLGTLCRLGWTTVLSLPLWVKKSTRHLKCNRKRCIFFMSLLLLLVDQLLRWPELLCSFMKGNSSVGCLKADICYKVQWLWKEQFVKFTNMWDKKITCLLNMYLWSQETFSLAWQKEILVQPQLVACSLVSFRGTARQIVLPFSFSARKRISQNAKLSR